MDTTSGPYALHTTRLVIRSTASAFYFVSFILYIVDGARCTNETNNYNAQNADLDIDTVDSSVCWTEPGEGDLRPMLVALVAIIWNIAELITLCINKRGIHPGANLGMDIALWLDGVVNAIVCFVLFVGYTDDEIYLSATSLLLIASKLQFVLFILDTIAVHKWRRARYAYRTPYVYPTQGIPQGYILPQAQPGFVYVQVPATAVAPQQMMQSPVLSFDPRQSVVPSTGTPLQAYSDLEILPGNDSVPSKSRASATQGVAV